LTVGRPRWRWAAISAFDRPRDQDQHLPLPAGDAVRGAAERPGWRRLAALDVADVGEQLGIGSR
jgi:hypothetical protein